jgi:phage shock protein PspC (stress-responsive transcriptional regulator)
MSATMSYRSAPMMQGSWISGVCADIAERAAVPVWLPRAAFVLFGVMHWLLAAILYFALARIVRPRTREALRERFAPPPPSYGVGPLQQRFRSLDERLSNLEAATVRNEAALRRAFRDLER